MAPKDISNFESKSRSTISIRETWVHDHTIAIMIKYLYGTFKEYTYGTYTIRFALKFEAWMR